MSVKEITGKIIRSKIGYSKMKYAHFDIMPDKEIKGCFNIRIRKVNMFIDWDLGLHSNQKCAGVYSSVTQAREFISKNFLN